MNANSAPSCATRTSFQSSFPVGTGALSPPLGVTSRVVLAVRASSARAPPSLCQERATLSCSRSVPLVKQSIQNRASVHLRSFMQEKVSSLVSHELSRVGIRRCPSTSAVIQLVSNRAATQRLWCVIQGLTLSSSGLAPAWRFRPSFHSGPYAPCRREPLMSNVRPRKHPHAKRCLASELHCSYNGL